jgi:glycyl-tRNA synthetase
LPPTERNFTLNFTPRPAVNFAVTASMLEIKRERKKLAGRNFTPSVIEPSFGIGRIIYCVFEHSYYTREGDDTRAVFK